MSAGKYTPGPWEVGNHIHCDCRESPTCWHMFNDQREIFPPLGESGPIACVAGESEANAHLIAAAPEMYEAMAEFVHRCEIGEVRSRKTYAKFKEILAKAEGR